MSSKNKLKKEKSKIIKLIEKSDSEDDNEHELSYYINDRVKLMKEVLKIIKPKKIKSMAPDCIKDLDIEEINSMLLEELLGISNKRLKYIFNGQNLDEDSSSTDPEEERQPIDIISLDDVSDDDFVIDLDSDKSTKNKKSTKRKVKKIKKEKPDKSSKKNSGNEKLGEENLMSVLELLELQARARAIRSQLMLEASKKNQSQIDEEVKVDEDSDTDAVIIESPKNDEIVITSSDSESEQNKRQEKESHKNSEQNSNSLEIEQNVNSTNEKAKKIKLIRDRVNILKVKETSDVSNKTEENSENVELAEESHSAITIDSGEQISSEQAEKNVDENKSDNPKHYNEDEDDVIVVDQDEINRLIGE